MKDRLITQDTILAEARLLLSRPRFTQEDNARVHGLLGLAEQLREPIQGSASNSPEARALDNYLRTKTTRDLGIGSPTQSTGTGVLIHQEFYRRLTTVLKAFDRLFDRDVVTIVETATGAPQVMPSLDDTAQAAAVIAESQQDPDPPTAGQPQLITAAKLGTPSTYRTGIVTVSTELAQDSAFPIADILAQSFAIRIARGAGPNLVTALLSAALVGSTAAGSSTNTGGAETGATSVGTTDLVALIESVNSAYRSGPRVGFLMSDLTLLNLDSLIGKNGHPVIHPTYNADGQRLLYGYPVHLCPSFPSIGLNAKPIAFGNLSYFIVRAVSEATNITTLYERFAELGQIGYRGQIRINGLLLGVTSTDSPVKVLQNAAA
jgi:HK97 family phage major capsid protein